MFHMHWNGETVTVSGNNISARLFPFSYSLRIQYMDNDMARLASEMTPTNPSSRGRASMKLEQLEVFVWAKGKLKESLVTVTVCYSESNPPSHSNIISNFFKHLIIVVMISYYITYYFIYEFLLFKSVSPLSETRKKFRRAKNSYILCFNCIS